MPTSQLNVGYRPLRLGLLTRPRSLADFVSGVRFASCLWGGRFDPILGVAREPGRFSEASRKFRLDALHPVVSTPAILDAIASEPELRWPLVGDGLLRDEGWDRARRLAITDLGIALELSEPPRERAVLPVWDESDPHGPVYAATFGDLSDADELGPGLRERYLERTGASEVSAADVARADEDLFVPLAASAAGIHWEPEAGSFGLDGIFVGSPASPTDLRAFWNIRAAGSNLLFWDKTDASGGPFGEAIAARLRVEAERLAGDEARIPHVRCYVIGRTTRRARLPEELEALAPDPTSFWVEVLRDDVGQMDSWHYGFVVLPRPDSEMVIAHVEPWGATRSKVVVPLPRSPLARREVTERQAVVVEIETYVDSGYEGTLKLPCLPDLNGWYRNEVTTTLDSVRVAEDRVGFISELLTPAMELYPLPHRLVVERLFERAGIRAVRSLPGEAAWHLLVQLGGLGGASVLRVPGIRRLLSDNSSRTGILRSRAQEMIRDGGSIETAETIYGGRRRFDAADLWTYLLHRRIFLPGLQVRCPQCQHKGFIPMRDANDDVTCPKCADVFPLAPALRGDPLRFRLSGLLEDRPSGPGSAIEGQPAAIPVLLTLLYLSEWSGSIGATILETSVQLTGDGMNPCEADIVAVAYGDRPEPYVHVVVGECKGQGRVEPDDVEKLSAVAARFRESSGVRCDLLFSTTRDSFTPEENALFRHAFKSSADRPALRQCPILLTLGELSFGRYSRRANGPHDRFGPGFTRLAEWSEERLP